MENVKHRGLAGLVAAAIALVLLSFAPNIADERASAYASEGGYAMLYDSGTLVLQRDAEPDGRYGVLTQAFQGVENQALSSLVGDAKFTVRAVVVRDRISCPSRWGYFKDFTACESIEGLSNLDMSATTETSRMFKGCANLRAIDLSGVAMPNVKNAFGMFDGCSSLESLGVQGCAMPAVQDVSYMFRGCVALQMVDLSFLSGAPLVSINEMFDGCSSLKGFDAKPLDTSSCTTMLRMFRNCSSLVSLDLTPFDTLKVTDMSWMFSGCASLAALDLSSFTSSSSVNMGYMFNNCTKLSKVSLGSGFVFAGNCKLPCPSSDYIPGADGFWHAASGGSYEPSGVPSGKADTYYAMRSEVPGLAPASVERIAGDYANQTSALISSEAFASSEWVVLARDDDFADAMSATGLAGALECPIVLTGQYGLSSAAAAEVQRLGAKHAYVIGGPGAMPGDFERDLAELGCTVEQRVFGEYAHDTSVECAKLIAQHGGGADAIVAMGANFQDALSISSFAYAYKLPIFLTVPWGERGLPASAVDAVRGMAGDIWVPGGPGAVPTSQVEGVFEGRTFHRIYGYDGYETSNAIAHHMVENGLLSAESCVVACGAQGPKGTDALAGAALAGRAKAPVLLVNGNSALGGVDYTTVDAGASDGKEAFMKSESPSIAQVWVLGGAFVMPQETVDRISAVLER